MESKINLFREKLHRELKANNTNKEKILKLSQELDELIVEYYKREEKRVVDF